MPPMSPARRRALGAVLSALAGGGLTAAGLGVPAVALAGPNQPTEPVTLPSPPAETTPTTTSTPAATTPAPTTTAPTTTPTETVNVKVPTSVAPSVKVKHRQRSTKG